MNYRQFFLVFFRFHNPYYCIFDELFIRYEIQSNHIHQSHIKIVNSLGIHASRLQKPYFTKVSCVLHKNILFMEMNSWGCCLTPVVERGLVCLHLAKHINKNHNFYVVKKYKSLCCKKLQSVQLQICQIFVSWKPKLDETIHIRSCLFKCSCGYC